MSRWGIILWATVGLIALGRATGADAEGDGGSETGKPTTVITSREMTFHYGLGVAHFIGDVVLIDPEVKLNSDSLLVVFNDEGDIDRIEAEGNVVIWQEGRQGTCAAAVYTARNGMIRMLGGGDPDRPRPARLMTGVDALIGEEIRIYLHQEKIVSNPGTLVLFPGEESESTGLNRLRLKSQGN